MTTFTFISNALVAVGAKPFATTVQAFRDNILSGLEADASAPVNQTHWHPYNKVTNGDANDGVIYDQAVHGTVANVVTPDFVDGYEYRLWLSRISCSTDSSSFGIELWREADAAYGSVISLWSFGAGGNAQNHSGYIIINRPRVAAVAHLVEYATGLSSTNGAFPASPTGSQCVRAAQKRLRARLAYSTGNIDLGVITMEKRRVIV